MRSFFPVLAASFGLTLSACGGAEMPPAPTPETPETPATPETPETPEPEAGGTQIEVALVAKSGSKLTNGTLTLIEEGDGVKVKLHVEGVTPGKHGAHIHEKADCSSEDGKSAGGHFNPAGVDHGLPDGARHLGDLGNIEVGEDGVGDLEIVIAGANLKDGDPSSYVGRGVIVHAKEDDGGQPTGNAGGRIACGEIKAP